MFENVDTNKDGRIDREEFSQDMKEDAFDKLDSDGDKEITELEWIGLDNITVRKKHNSLFKTIDIDKDRKITFFEFSSYADKHSNLEEAFIGLDRNKDNLLAPDEITSRPLFRMITIYF
jgi:Ca2+-binding EF-hand superfamily protein